jgi:carbon-monoxide dehydrogenase medium subunit
MKPAPFDYHRPSSREEVDELLARYGDDAKILAGGQSLIPLLSMRLIAPLHIVDINGLDGEASEPSLDGEHLAFGPLVRHVAVERSPEVAARLPLLTEAMAYVGHAGIRSRGTLVGAVAHADPASELPAAVAVLGGEARARSVRGARTVRAPDLFVGPLETSLREDEWLEEVRIPTHSSARGVAVEEFARRHGDYALCGVVATAERANGGVARGTFRVGLCYFGVGDVPNRLDLPELKAEEIANDALEEAVRGIVRAGLEPQDDIHATAPYRRRLAEKLGVRAARRAAGRVEQTAMERG